MWNPSLGCRSEGALAAIAARQLSAAAVPADSIGGATAFAADHLSAAPPNASRMHGTHGTAMAPGVRGIMGALYAHASVAPAFAIAYAV